MKKKSKRYYGMTVTQIGILVGAAVFGLLTIGIILVVVLTSTPKAQLPIATAVVSASTSTSTPAPTVAIETETPTPAPVVATVMPPGGWVQFDTPGVIFWLPSGYVGGDLVNNKQAIINKM